jgi:arylsulfatase A-like enzyme
VTSPSFPAFAAAIVSLAGGLSLAGEDPAPRRPPNIVIILADDLGAECLSSYGGTSYRTPHLDALARSGVRFESACATPLCSPSRVQLMTGRYGFRTGWTRLIGRDTPAFLDPGERTFGHVLKAAGYATALAGKWQLANFRERPDHVKECGFDEYCAWTWVIDGKKPSRYWDPAIWQDGKLREDTAGRHGEDVFADFLIDFMRRNRSRPFLAYYPMVLVHAPYDPTPAQADAAADAGRRRASRENFPAMVEYMDATVGRIVRAVEDLGLLEDTLIIFTADNGTPRDITSRVGPLEVRGGKGQVTHTGTHVPFIASWKGVTPPGRVVPDAIDLSDILPTIAEVARAPLPAGVAIDGRSFVPQLRGERGSPREWVYSQLGEARFARDRRWILHGDGRLHDLEADPLERNDLAASADPAAAAARRRLRAALEGLGPPR